MAIGRRWAIWAMFALLGGCNTFDDAPDDSMPRDLLPSRPPPPSSFGVMPRPAGSPAFLPVGGTGAVGAAGAGGMPVKWQPIDAGPPRIQPDADGGADDAG